MTIEQAMGMKEFSILFKPFNHIRPTMMVSAPLVRAHLVNNDYYERTLKNWLADNIRVEINLN